MLEDIAPDGNKVLESPREASGFCPRCHGIAHFVIDKELGCLKKCPICGYSENLLRRPLKFDKQSRQWL